MTETKESRTPVPVNRIETFYGGPRPHLEWGAVRLTETGNDVLGQFFQSDCRHGDLISEKTGEEHEREEEAPNWMKLAQRLVGWLPLEKRIEVAEKGLKDLSVRVARLEGLYEKAIQAPFCVPISTLAPEPFELVGTIFAVIQQSEGGYTASFLDANLGASGETKIEALEGLKDRIVTTFERLERKTDDKLGPGPLRQKRVLTSLIRRH